MAVERRTLHSFRMANYRSEEPSGRSEGLSVENWKGPRGLRPSAVQRGPLSSQRGSSVFRRDSSAGQRGHHSPIGQRALRQSEVRPAIGQGEPPVGQRPSPLPVRRAHRIPDWLSVGQKDSPLVRGTLRSIRGTLRRGSERHSAEGRKGSPV